MAANKFHQDFSVVWIELLKCTNGENSQTLLSLVLKKTTPITFLPFAVHPEAEHDLNWMINHVHPGQQKRYQLWFFDRFISKDESCLPDLARLICFSCVKESSLDLVPRWALLGWLCKLSNVTSDFSSQFFYYLLILFSLHISLLKS